MTREELKEKCCDVCFYSDEGQASPSVRMMGCKRRMAYEMKKGYERGVIEGQKNPLFGKILDLKDDNEGGE